MKTRKNIVLEFDDESDIYIRKNIAGIDDDCPVPYTPYKITVHRDNPAFISRGNCLIKKDTKTLIFAGLNFTITNDGSVKIIGIHAFARWDNYGSPNGVINVPPAVKHIYPEAFYWSDADYIYLHDGLKSIGTRAFGYSGIKSAYIPRTVKRIAEDAFFKCNLSEIKSDSPRYIAKNGCLIERDTRKLIAVCARKKIVIPDGVKEIASGVFWANVKQAEVYIPASVHKICGHNFYDCYRRIYTVKDKSDYIDEPITLIARKNSYAEYFAKKHGVAYKIGDNRGIYGGQL